MTGLTPAPGLSDAFKAALREFRLPVASIHGPAHWLRVLRNGRDLAARTPGADLAVVEHFAVLHDCCRIHDHQDTHHGQRAAAFVVTLHAAGALALDGRQAAILRDACAEHELGRVSPDPTIGACWDADRLELSRVGRGPATRLLSTTAALDPGLQADAWARGWGHAVDPGEPLAGLLPLPEPAPFSVDFTPAFYTHPSTGERIPEGEMVLRAYRDGSPASSLRTIMRMTWRRNAHAVIHAARDAGVSLMDVFRAAAFDVPASLPDEFPVWRAAATSSASYAAGGHCWTLDRQYAYGLAGLYLASGVPDGATVVQRTVRRAEVVFYWEHCTREVVFDSPPRGEVAGTPVEWLYAQAHLAEFPKLFTPGGGSAA